MPCYKPPKIVTQFNIKIKILFLKWVYPLTSKIPILLGITSLEQCILLFWHGSTQSMEKKHAILSIFVMSLLGLTHMPSFPLKTPAFHSQRASFLPFYSEAMNVKRHSFPNARENKCVGAISPASQSRSQLRTDWDLAIYVFSLNILALKLLGWPLVNKFI